MAALSKDNGSLKEKRGGRRKKNVREQKNQKKCEEKLLWNLTLFDTLEPDGVFAVFDHGVHVPGGESSHGGVIDFQQEFILEEFAAVARRSTRGELPDNRELSILRAALQLQPQLPLLIPAKDTLVDFVSPVVPPLLQALGHGSSSVYGEGGKYHMSAAVEEVSVALWSVLQCHR